MIDKQTQKWSRIVVLDAFEYPQHAGLSTDGRLCFLAEYDDVEYLVWDIRDRKVIWRANAPDLNTWIQDGHIEITEGAAKGSYRIFGLHYKHALQENRALDIALNLDEENDLLILTQISTGQVIQQLKYESSTDWAYTSFSDDCSVIAVLTTHSVTFFGQLLSI